MSNITAQFITELKNKITLSEFIQPAISQWDKSKSNPSRQDWWASCPFHHEKTSSFHVDNKKGYYHCFGCNTHGSIIDWLINYQRMSYIDAIKHLCNITHTEMPKLNSKQKEHLKSDKNLYDIIEIAQDFFTTSLFNNPTALEYLTHKRNISPHLIKKFNIGFAPNHKNSLINLFTSHNISLHDATQTGLIIASDDNTGKYYDRFRNRITFPVYNTQGKIITFGARALDKNTKSKYLNGPETEIFKKSHVLYNLNQAIQGYTKIKPFIVAEGYVDVIALTKAGFIHSVAPMGTALTLEQIKLLWRYTSEPILCFDGDKAGLNAAKRIAHNALTILSAGYSIQFCFLPEGLDPDDYLKKYSITDFNTLISKPVTLSSVLFADALQQSPPDTPERCAGLEKELSNLTSTISDNRLRILYQNDFKKKLRDYIYNNNFNRTTYKSHYLNREPSLKQSFLKNNHYASSYTEYNNISHSLNTWRATKLQKNDSYDRANIMEVTVLGFFLQFLPYIQAHHIHFFSQINFDTPEKKQLQSEILDVFMKNQIYYLENESKIHRMSPDASEALSQYEDIWQLPDEICQTNLYKQCLSEVPPLSITLTHRFKDKDDIINHVDNLCNGIHDMYHKFFHNKNTHHFLKNLTHDKQKDNIVACE